MVCLSACGLLAKDLGFDGLVFTGSSNGEHPHIRASIGLKLGVPGPFNGYPGPKAPYCQCQTDDTDVK
jgi:hypothetical protein